MTDYGKPYMTCPACSLVQFERRNNSGSLKPCLRCKWNLNLAVTEPIKLVEVVAEKPVDTNPSEITTREFVKNDLFMARAIRAFRMQRNLTQPQLAKLCNVNRTYISKLESGRSIPTLQSLDKISRALRLPPWDLLHQAYLIDREEKSSVQVVPDSSPR
jgi:DNA-binding XRE family transcriptional regulator